jgi:methionyl-tRNA synthetase
LNETEIELSEFTEALFEWLNSEEQIIIVTNKKNITYAVVKRRLSVRDRKICLDGGIITHG